GTVRHARPLQHHALSRGARSRPSGAVYGLDRWARDDAHRHDHGYGGHARAGAARARAGAADGAVPDLPQAGTGSIAGRWLAIAVTSFLSVLAACDGVHDIV